MFITKNLWYYTVSRLAIRFIQVLIIDYLTFLRRLKEGSKKRLLHLPLTIDSQLSTRKISDRKCNNYTRSNTKGVYG